MRYFINLSDAVSSAFLGDGKVANVVYRSGSALEPMKNHSVDSWYPGDYGSLHTKQIALEQNGVNDLRHSESAPVADGDPTGYTVHFGADDWDQQFSDFFTSSRNAKQGNPFPTAPSWRHADTTAPAPAAAFVPPGHAPSHVDMAAVRQLERRDGN